MVRIIVDTTIEFQLYKIQIYIIGTLLYFINLGIIGKEITEKMEMLL